MLFSTLFFLFGGSAAGYMLYEQSLIMI